MPKFVRLTEATKSGPERVWFVSAERIIAIRQDTEDTARLVLEGDETLIVHGDAGQIAEEASGGVIVEPEGS